MCAGEIPALWDEGFGSYVRKREKRRFVRQRRTRGVGAVHLELEVP